MYLITGAKRTVLAISEHPFLAALLVLLQLLSAAALFYTIFTYQTQLLQDATALLENPSAISAGSTQPVSSSDIVKLYQHYTSFINTAKRLLGWLAVVLLVSGGILWGLSHRLLEEKVKSGTLFPGYLIAVVVILLPGLLAGYYSLKLLMAKQSLELLGSTWRDWGIIMLISYYLLLVALAVLPTAAGKGAVKESVKRWWKTVISLHKTIPVLLINAVIIAGFLALLLWKMWFWALIPLLMLIPLLRLFWISCLKEITEDGRSEKKPAVQNSE